MGWRLGEKLRFRCRGRDLGLWISVWSFEVWIEGLRFRVKGLGCRRRSSSGSTDLDGFTELSQESLGFGFRVRDPGFGLRVGDIGFRVWAA